MPAQVGLGLSRVTVAAPERRIDVALPDNAIVAELLPHLLRHAGERLADEGEDHGGWVLRRSTGAALDATRTLAVQGVRDGEVLQFVPRRLEWPELAYDDVVDVIAGGARRTGRTWGNVATRRCGLATAAAVLALGLGALPFSGPPWSAPAAMTLILAVALVIAGILLSRAFADATAGAVVAGSGLPYAFAGGALLAAPADASITNFGASALLLGSAALIACSVIGYTGVAAGRWVFTAGLAAGFAGLLAAVLGGFGVSVAGSAAVVLTVAIGLLPGYPLIASWLGKLPVPELPTRPEAIIEDRPVPKRSEVFASVARATALLTGMLFSAAIVSICAMAVLVAEGTRTATLLCLTGAGALLLRGRLFPTPMQRVPLLVGGMAGLAMLGFAVALRGSAPGVRAALVVAMVGAAWLVLAAGLAYSKRAPSPYVGRIGDICDVLAIMLLIPLACAILGVYDTIRGLFASIGG